MSKHFFFIINPSSGKKSVELEKIIINFFEHLDDRFTIFISESFKQIKDLTIKAMELKANAVVACGGDGTVNMVGQTLVGTNIQLGIIPIGSGNGVSNNMKIPSNYKDALQKLISGSVKKIDVGKIDNFYFFSNLGFGLEAEFIRQYQQMNLHGFIPYLFSFLRSLFSYKAQNIEIEINNSFKKKINSDLLMFVNANEQGYGLSVYPDAKIDDGFLNFISVRKTNSFYTIYLMIKILFGISIKSKKTLVFDNVESANITSNNNYISFQIDGEYLFLPKNKLKISIIPGALSILC